jgi:LysM repeat protein
MRSRVRFRAMIWGQAALGCVALGVLAAACGSGDNGSGSEVTPGPNTTPFRTLPPVTPTVVESTLSIEDAAIYVVKRGDYPSLILRRAGGGCSVSDLQRVNRRVNFDTFPVGTELVIPPSCLKEGVTVEDMSTTVPESDAETDDSSSVSDDTVTPVETTKELEVGGTYKVKKGDYWYKIAKLFDCELSDLRAVNRGVTKLYPNKTLKIPENCFKKLDEETTKSTKKSSKSKTTKTDNTDTDEATD